MSQDLLKTGQKPICLPCPGLAWFGLVRPGLAWFGLVWPGLAWFALVLEIRSPVRKKLWNWKLPCSFAKISIDSRWCPVVSR